MVTEVTVRERGCAEAQVWEGAREGDREGAREGEGVPTEREAAHGRRRERGKERERVRPRREGQGGHAGRRGTRRGREGVRGQRRGRERAHPWGPGCRAKARGRGQESIARE